MKTLLPLIVGFFICKMVNNIPNVPTLSSQPLAFRATPSHVSLLSPVANMDMSSVSIRNAGQTAILLMFVGDPKEHEVHPGHSFPILKASGEPLEIMVCGTGGMPTGPRQSKDNRVFFVKSN